MINSKLGYHSIGQNYGYYIDRAPQNVLEELRQQIDELQSNFSKGEKWNDMLAGEIQHEYKILPQFQVKKYIRDLTQQFENESQYMTSNYIPLPSLEFNSLWVNFQKKYEYNPIHNHTGVYSFVIWYKIPYRFEDELKYHYGSDGRKKCVHGKFSFMVPSPFSKIYNVSNYNLDIDNTKEGYVAVFPSTLHHIVYPFYSSDGYRITVAGNIESTNKAQN